MQDLITNQKILGTLYHHAINVEPNQASPEVFSRWLDSPSMQQLTIICAFSWVAIKFAFTFV